MEKINFKTILCATDFSEPSMAAVDYAINIARSFGARIIFLYVVKNLKDSYITYDSDYGVEVQKSESKEAKKKMEEITRDLDIEYKTMVIQGKPHEEIIEKTKEFQGDLIVLGTRGRSGLSHLLLGSTAEKVLRTAACPVTVVKTSE